MSQTLGFLFPGLGSAEDDLEWLVKRLYPNGDVRARIIETPIDEDAHTVKALLDLGQAWRLREGVEAVRDEGVDAMIWACTSGSFVFGWEGAQAQVEELAGLAGVPTSSTSLSFAAALRALGLKRVAIAATYPKPVTDCFVALLADAGFEVVGVESNDIPTAVGVGQVNADALERMVRAGDRPDADVVLVPDTALHTVRELPRLEGVLGKPILSANQVTVWDGLRLIGALPDDGDGTRLFARG